MDISINNIEMKAKKNVEGTYNIGVTSGVHCNILKLKLIFGPRRGMSKISFNHNLYIVFKNNALKQILWGQRA